MAIRTSSVSFPPLRGGGPRSAQSTVVYRRTVLRAVAGSTNLLRRILVPQCRRRTAGDFELRQSRGRISIVVSVRLGPGSASGRESRPKHACRRPRLDI
jgi:hypothetical protein